MSKSSTLYVGLDGHKDSKLVAPYRMSGKRGKNDAADAAAICEAVQRPNMRFVALKSQEQQSRLMDRLRGEIRTWRC